MNFCHLMILWVLLITARDCPRLPGDCPGIARGLPETALAVWSCFKSLSTCIKVFSTHLACYVACVSLRSAELCFQDSRMLHLCGYFSVGQLCNGKWLNIPVYFNNEWSRNYRIRSRKLYRVYQKKVHSWKKFTKIRCARNLRKLSAVSLCILTFSGSVFRAAKPF
jgi:hypothetical protein